VLVSEPFEDLGGRLLLGALAAGFTGVGLLSMFMAPLDSDATEYVFAMSAGVAILGVLGLIGAAVGRALARWLLVAVGIVVVGVAVDGLVDSLRWRPDLLESVLFGGIVVLGVSACVVGGRSIARRRRTRVGGPSQRLAR
jgi:hypothetical protein